MKNAASASLDGTVPLWRTMLVFLVPLMLTNVLQSANGLLTSIFLGRMIGVRALAAISAFFPILFLLISFFIGIASASSILIGRAYGAKDEARMREVAGTMLTVSAASGALLGLAGALSADALLRALGTPADIFPQTHAYARVIFLALPLLFLFLGYTTIARGTGDSATPFFALILSTIVTLVATPALIAGWFGLPHLGVSSAAATSVIANFAGLLAMLAILAARKHPLRFDRRMASKLGIRWPILVELIRIGIPTGVQLVTVSLSEIAVLSFVNHFGSQATAAYGAVNQIVSYVQFPAISIGITASIFGAQSIGARKFERLGTVVRSAVVLNYAIGGAAILAVYLLANEALSLFLTDEPTRALAHSLLSITLWSYAVFGNAAVLAGVMRSSGTVLWPTALGILSIWGVQVPVAYFLMQRLGIDGIWIAYPVAFCTNLLLQYIYYSTAWKKTLHTLADRFPAAVRTEEPAPLAT